MQLVRQTGYGYQVSFSAPGMASVNQPAAVMERWRQPGDKTTIQQFTRTSGSAAHRAYGQAQSYGDNRIVDASFARLKNITVTFRLSRTRFYVRAQNLITFTDYSGLDPENQNTLALPPLKMVAAGIDISL